MHTFLWGGSPFFSDVSVLVAVWRIFRIFRFIRLTGWRIRVGGVAAALCCAQVLMFARCTRLFCVLFVEVSSFSVCGVYVYVACTVLREQVVASALWFIVGIRKLRRFGFEFIVITFFGIGVSSVAAQIGFLLVCVELKEDEF